MYVQQHRRSTRDGNRMTSANTSSERSVSNDNNNNSSGWTVELRSSYNSNNNSSNNSNNNNNAGLDSAEKRRPISEPNSIARTSLPSAHTQTASPNTATVGVNSMRLSTSKLDMGARLSTSKLDNQQHSQYYTSGE